MKETFCVWLNLIKLSCHIVSPKLAIPPRANSECWSMVVIRFEIYVFINYATFLSLESMEQPKFRLSQWRLTWRGFRKKKMRFPTSFFMSQLLCCWPITSLPFTCTQLYIIFITHQKSLFAWTQSAQMRLMEDGGKRKLLLFLCKFLASIGSLTMMSIFAKDYFNWIVGIMWIVVINWFLCKSLCEILNIWVRFSFMPSCKRQHTITEVTKFKSNPNFWRSFCKLSPTVLINWF